MLKKSLALLLVVSLVILSGIDLLEDFDLPHQLEVHSPLVDQQQAGPVVDLANNILESGDRDKLCHLEMFELAAARLSLDLLVVSKKAFRLHKLHCIYLI